MSATWCRVCGDASPTFDHPCVPTPLSGRATRAARHGGGFLDGAHWMMTEVLGVLKDAPQMDGLRPTFYQELADWLGEKLSPDKTDSMGGKNE